MNRVGMLWIIISMSFGQEALFEKANTAYQMNDYQSALQYYKQIEANGFRAPELYFNMGNTYYKQGELGLAILYYERARKLDPLDEDILTNLEIANEQTVDDLRLPEQSWIFDAYLYVRNVFTVNQLLIVVLLAFSFVFIAYFLKRWVLTQSEWLMNGLIVGAAIVCLMAGLLASVRISNLQIEEGIVLEESVEVFSNPNDDTKAFILHEGTKFEVKRKLNDRYEIRLIDGKTGWIGINDAALI